jgi:hypothetical protein
MTLIPGAPTTPTNLSASIFDRYRLRLADPDTGYFYAKTFYINGEGASRPTGSAGLYVEFDIDNFKNYIEANTVDGDHFAIDLYDSKADAPFSGRSGSEFGYDAISTGVGVAIGNLSYSGTVYQCVWLEAFRKGDVSDCLKQPGSTNRDRILLDYGLGPLSNLVNNVTVKVWSSKTASGRYDVGVQVVDRANPAITLLAGSNPAYPALAVMDPTGYRITGANAGTLDTTATNEYSFSNPQVSVIAVKHVGGNVGTGINETPRISAARYTYY